MTRATTSTTAYDTATRRVRLRLDGCSRPPTAIVTRTKLEIDIDLKKAFHHGYIDLHGRMPAVGTNPLFDEYSNLLADSPYLIWNPPGIAADDDGRSGESHRLGRSLSRAYLEQHCGFTWFAHVSELVKRPQDGWSAGKREDGDMPDWLVSNGSDTVVAEAKGRSRSINAELKKWRKQVLNIDVKKDGTAVSLPTYIVANRWVNSSQPRARPELYVEDPPTTGRALTDNDTPGIGLWAMRVHTAQNLVRLGQRLLAERVLSSRRVEDERVTAVLVWRCGLPALAHLRFMGRRVSPATELACHDMLALLDASLFDLWTPPPRRPGRWWLWLANAVEERRQSSYFDGVSLDVVKESLFGDNARRTAADSLELPPDVSLLSDGSLIAPASLMYVSDVIQL